MDNSGDYISRKAAIVASIYTSPMMPSQWLPIQHAIEAIPAADVRPVARGKWIDDKGNPVPWDELNKNCPSYGACCSVCGDWLTGSDEYPAVGNFCPNCGADMRPEEGE